MMALAFPFSYIPAACLLYGENHMHSNLVISSPNIVYRFVCWTWRACKERLEGGPQEIQYCKQICLICRKYY